MITRITISAAIWLTCISFGSYSQVDTSYLHHPSAPFGALDVRIAKSPHEFYYLEESVTFSFREVDGVPTKTYLNMTAWDSHPYGEGNLRQRTPSSDLFVMNYRLLQPRNYDTTFSPGYPLVIVMHGFLERGNCAASNCYFADAEFSPNDNKPPAPTSRDHQLLNNDYNLVHAGFNYLNAHNLNEGKRPDDPNLSSKGFPGFVLFPQNLNGWDPAASEDVIRLIRLLSKNYNIDQDRIYINGVSHGGHGAYEVLKRAPWMFAAAVMFSAADDASVVSQKMTSEIAHIPLWIFQGGQDTNPTKDETDRYVRAFRKAGANVRYTLYPHLGHGTWNKALDEPDFFSWLLDQDRSNIHVPGGNSSICSTSGEGLLLSLPKGFKSYEWEYNGAVIARSPLNTYRATQPGTYRARFLMFNDSPEGEWGSWSQAIDIKLETPEVPEVKQIGTLWLPDLNGNETARLEAKGDFPHYYWYKDGKPLKTFGDTLRSIRLTAAIGSGSYTLRVAGYDRCKSQESEAHQLMFEESGLADLPAPYDLKGEALSPSEVMLHWSDSSQQKVRLEIWRRSEDASGNYSLWEMSDMTEPASTSFVDKDLLPSTVYHYKVRAVTTSQTSPYAPSGTRHIVVKTPVDAESPTPPRELTAVLAGVNTIRLRWIPSSDNSSIKEYLIFANGDSLHSTTVDSTFLLTGLRVNTDYSFVVRAVDLAGNISQASNNAHANTYLEGLYYEHSTGAWQNLKMIDWSTPEYRGFIADFNLEGKTQEDFFNFLFDGFLSVVKEGVYQFRITSDDGSALSLNDSLLIENDGIHNIHTVTSPIMILPVGPHRITLKYFDYVLSDTLLVEYKGPDSDGAWMKIPEQALVSSIVTSTENVEEREFNFSVYPNPAARENINISLQSNSAHPVYVDIKDATGRILFKTIVEYETEIKINLPVFFEKGLYILSIKQGDHLFNRRIVIR